GALLLSPAFAAPALAATTTPVSMTLVEAVAPGASAGCAVLQNGTGLCGHGQVSPYGQATESVLFNGGWRDKAIAPHTSVGGRDVPLDSNRAEPELPWSVPSQRGRAFLGRAHRCRRGRDGAVHWRWRDLARVGDPCWRGCGGPALRNDHIALSQSGPDTATCRLAPGPAA